MSFSSSAVMLQQSGADNEVKTVHIYAPLRKVQEPKLLRIKKKVEVCTVNLHWKRRVKLF